MEALETSSDRLLRTRLVVVLGLLCLLGAAAWAAATASRMHQREMQSMRALADLHRMRHSTRALLSSRHSFPALATNWDAAVEAFAESFANLAQSSANPRTADLAAHWQDIHAEVQPARSAIATITTGALANQIGDEGVEQTIARLLSDPRATTDLLELRRVQRHLGAFDGLCESFAEPLENTASALAQEAAAATRLASTCAILLLAGAVLTGAWLLWHISRLNRHLIGTLAAKEKMLSRIMHTAPVGVCLLQSGHISVVNHHIELLSGYSAGELLGKPPLLFAMPDAVMSQLLAGGGGPDGGGVQTCLTTRSGARREVLLYASPLIPHDQQAGVVVIVIDITERRRMEAELQHSEWLFRQIFERSPIGKVTLGLDQRLLRCNLAFLDFVGRGHEELAGVDLRDLTWPEDRSAGSEEMQSLIAGRITTCQVQKRYSHKSGLPVWAEVTMSLVRDAGGSPLYILAALQDISERRQAEAEMRQHEAMQAAMIANISDVIGIIGADGVMRYKSANIERYFGWKPHDRVGTSGWDTVHPEDLARIQALFFELLQQDNATREMEFRYACKDGTYKPIHLTAVNLLADPSLNGVLLNYHDITERTEAERRNIAQLHSLQALNRELLLATARAEDLAHEAKKASLAKSQFLATMSHEIRNPLNGVIGMTDLLMRTSLTTEQTQMATVIQSSGSSLLTVIGDVLDMARIESGSLILECRECDPRRLAEDVFGTFTVPAQRKGLRLALSVDAAVPAWVSGDAGRLRQILINLVGNAVKFTEQGNVSMRVRVLSLDARRVTLAWDVSDTGPGIPDDYLQHLFEPFTQADASMSRRHGGAGLGLSISKRLTDLLGGSISVDTILGEGTCFHLTIPLDICLAKAGTPANATEPTTPPAWSRQPRILVVEDEHINQLTLEFMLARLGCQYRLTGNGLEAIAAVAEGGYDLVLMDCQMPECDGYTAARTIRERTVAGMRRLPIIALTGNAFTEDRERCRLAGMDDFLAKPCTLDSLKACLLRWIDAGAEPSGIG